MIKKIFKYLILPLFLLSLFPHLSFAEGYPLTTSISGTTIKASMPVPPEDTTKYQLQISNTPFINPYTPTTIASDSQTIVSAQGGLVVWNIFPVDRSVTYYLRAVKYKAINTGTFEVVSDIKMIQNFGEVQVANQKIELTWPLPYTPDPDNKNIFILAGKLDRVKNATISDNISNYSVELSVSNNSSFEGSRPFTPQHGDLSAPLAGIGPDGTYYFKIDKLTPGTRYFIKQVVNVKVGSANVSRTDTGIFSPEHGFTPEGELAEEEDNRVYNLLAPWPGLTKIMNPEMCRNEKNLGTIPEDSICDVNAFLNFVFKTLIGLAAVGLVLRLIFEGYQYMVTDVPFLKANAKSGFITALFGLLLALCAYLILNTLNPKLVDNSINVESVDLGVENFIISGALSSSFDQKPIKVNFNKEAYPAAKNAFDKTGVNTAFLLAIFSQETGSGANVGACKYNDQAARMQPEDIEALKIITRELNKNIENTPVSCAIRQKNGQYIGYGGAIGYTQVLPSTWLGLRTEAKGHLGHTPNPWDVSDALMVTAVYLKRVGAINNEREAACKYYAGPGRSCAYRSDVAGYGNSVMGKKLSIQKQISDAIVKGEIK